MVFSLYIWIPEKPWDTFIAETSYQTCDSNKFLRDLDKKTHLKNFQKIALKTTPNKNCRVSDQFKSEKVNANEIWWEGGTKFN